LIIQSGNQVTLCFEIVINLKRAPLNRDLVIVQRVGLRGAPQLAVLVVVVSYGDLLAVLVKVEHAP
jgi:hypothetical protein